MAINKKVRELVYKKYNCKCAYCGVDLKEMKDMQVDHIYSQYLYKYGTRTTPVFENKDDVGNLNPACRSCNKFKSSWTIEEFRREIEMQYQRHISYTPTFRLMDRYGIIKKQIENIEFYFEKYERENNEFLR